VEQAQGRKKSERSFYFARIGFRLHATREARTAIRRVIARRSRGRVVGLSNSGD
jgi:hypothetical protein